LLDVASHAVLFGNDKEGRSVDGFDVADVYLEADADGAEGGGENGEAVYGVGSGHLNGGHAAEAGPDEDDALRSLLADIGQGSSHVGRGVLA
jgi:hypothetical protein